MKDTSAILTLDEIGIACNTDKSSRSRSRPDIAGEVPKLNESGHDYLRKYEFFLNRFRDKSSFTLLELGAGPDWNIGASARLWQQYFTRSDFKLRIADIKESAIRLNNESTEVLVGDLGKRSFLLEISEGAHDVIIDDASHFWGHQLLALRILFKSLNEGGIYIIEDIHTSFGKMRERYAKNASRDTYSVLVSLATLIAGKGRTHPILESAQEDDFSPIKLWRSIESVTFINHSCIITKNGFY
jgi:hypothetical protein